MSDDTSARRQALYRLLGDLPDRGRPLGARLIGPEVARDCLRVFLETPFEGGRHAPRVAKLSAC